MEDRSRSRGVCTHCREEFSGRVWEVDAWADEHEAEYGACDVRIQTIRSEARNG